MKSKRIAFSVLLPVVSLALLVLLVAAPVTFVYMSLHDGALQDLEREYEVSGIARPTSAGQFFLLSLRFEPEAFANALNGIDVPANFVELPIDRLRPTWPDTWYPAGLSVSSWRAITFPIYSLPFWWFAGLGLDALFKRRPPPRWGTLLCGTILCAVFLALALGLSFYNQPFEEPEVTIPIMIGAFLWTTLFAAFPITWVRSRASLSRQPKE